MKSLRASRFRVRLGLPTSLPSQAMQTLIPKHFSLDIEPNNRRITRGLIGDKSGGVIGLDYM